MSSQALFELAMEDVRAGALESARRRLREVTTRDPKASVAWHNLGAVCQDLRLWPQAAIAYRRAAALNPQFAETRFSLARMATILGRIQEAVACYRALAVDAAQRARALTRLAMIDAAQITAEDLTWMETAAGDGVAMDAQGRADLLFAIGHALEAAGVFDPAFDAFERANALHRSGLPAGQDAQAAANAIARSVAFMKTALNASFICEHAAGGGSAADPIFVVGMPRSGSTLIEQILASHAGVRGLGEIGALGPILDGVYRAWPARTDFASYASAYLSAVDATGRKGALRTVDKTLENYLHVGAIHLMFPKAVIIESVRDPVETCLACWRQRFASGAETLYDLADIGAEYRRYREIMDHWRDVLPGRVRRVKLEDLIASPEREIRRLVSEVSGLSWDANCLEFHRSHRPVTSASAAQVRNPIAKASPGRRSRYGARLAPLLEALGDIVDTD